MEKVTFSSCSVPKVTEITAGLTYLCLACAGSHTPQHFRAKETNVDPRRHLLRNAWITLLASIAFAAVLAIPGRAGAATPLTFVPSGPDQTASWYSAVPAAGVFSDDYTFTVGSASQITLQDVGTWFGGFSSLNAQVFNSTPTLMVTAPWLTNSTPTSLVAGNYTLNVSGTALFAGGYSGSVTLSTATVPIPEPETYAMMLAGLGLMGFVARRRRLGRVVA